MHVCERAHLYLLLCLTLELPSDHNHLKEKNSSRTCPLSALINNDNVVDRYEKSMDRNFWKLTRLYFQQRNQRNGRLKRLQTNIENVV